MLVDEQFGSTVPEEAREQGLTLAMPAERSGQKLFEFQYGDDFGAHIERYDPDFTKVLVRYNPDGDAADNERAAGQAQAPQRLAKAARAQASSSSCSCPPRTPSCEAVGGDIERYEAELRPELMRRAIAELQDGGLEVDVWKIEGVEERVGLRDARRAGPQRRARGVVCVVLGRGADDAKVDHWLTQAAPVDGFIGFAIGRSIWWDPLKAYVDGKIERSQGAQTIAANYLRFVEVYERAAGKTPVA